MHLARGVEGLDIALIDPDKTFEFKVPNYAKHRQVESRIEMPLPRGARTGVMAVTVSSKTLEATTLVIQSDLDVIVKSSRNEVFVFAENMRTGKPWPGVRLLVSNGQQVFAEGMTGADGVFQKSFKELEDAGDVRVFAVADGNVASNVVNLQGVGVARGLSDKGYIYTDRPAYRAGQIVHVRGCLRHASHDAFAVEKGKKYTLEVFDARNRLVWQEAVKLGEFGSFHASFLLPAASPQGEYRVLVHDDAGQNYQGGFLRPRVPLGAGATGDRHAAARLLSRRGDRGDDPGDVLLRGAAGRPRGPLPIGRRSPVHGHDRRRGRGPLQAAHARVQRNPVAPAPRGAARAKPDRGGQLHACGARVLDRREHGSAGLPGRRDVRGGGQRPRRRRQADGARNFA